MIRSPLPRLVGAAAPLRARLRVPSALHYREFRNYWLGLLASVTCYQMLVLFCLGWLISHELEEDARFLGYMSTAIALPAIALNVVGGVLADKFNLKRLLGVTQATTGAVVIGLAVLTVLDVVNYWHVLGAAFLIGAVQAFDNPIRQSISPRLVARKHLFNAVVLNSAVWTGTRIYAPALAAIIVAQTSIGTAIFVSAGGFLVLALVAQALRPAPLDRARGRVVSEMGSGFLFIRRNPVFSTLIAMTFVNSLFGMSYVFLMPVFADEVLDVGATKIGLLMGAAGLGALTGIIASANMSRFRHRGWLIIGGAGGFGVCLILFGVASQDGLYGVSMVILFLGDLSIGVYLMMVMSTLQSMVPDQFRGRVMGFYSITWSLLPLGGLQSSQIAHYVSAPAAVIIGGALVLAFAMGVAVTSRHVRRLGIGPEEHPPG